MARRLDADVAERLMGYSVVWAAGNPRIKELGLSECPHFSTRMQDAWGLVDFLWRKHGVTTLIRRNLLATVQVKPPEGDFVQCETKARDCPQAICSAALSLFELQ